MIRKIVLLTVLVVGVLAENIPLNRGNVASELVRDRRSPQDQIFPNFPNMPALPGFDQSNVVSQHTDSNKNGFAQTTIYKSNNGGGSSSVSFSKSGGTGSTLNLSAAIIAVFAVIRAMRI
ncbi:uncharacterized protein LOC129758118 [Uranotaenia lowii]|uniref:uncharacterized protein LOC129758118 n=1 Tax=Uranotaenia lowii TaxID=190385 RepID=UPI00247B0D09|nr:uncharacterized protein LOC129758118 [Uranotaenia lowii]